jgi:hypothetical protein
LDHSWPEVTQAGIGLLEAWTDHLARSGKSALGFHAFVAEALADCVQAQRQDDPVEALGHINTQVEDPWVLELLGHAQELIAPSQGGDGSVAQDDLLLAAALVLAAVLAITRAPQGEGGGGPYVVLLWGVLATLIALTIPEHKNQTVLLVRA